MDSLTQIVLGAAVGEAVLGKKVGNKAMLWGAVAGTIPDLETVLRRIDGRAPVLVEIKDQSGAFGPGDGALRPCVRRARGPRKRRDCWAGPEVLRSWFAH